MAVSASRLEVLSPELVLVDPRLAIDARASLSDPDDTLARLEPAGVAPVAEETAAALRRIIQVSYVEEPPRHGRSYLAAKRAAAIATWSTVALLVADTQLYDWPAVLH